MKVKIFLRKNRYCELTAQYYVWKNYEKLGNPDYVGFCHYRRLFNFNSGRRFYGPVLGGSCSD